MEMASSCRNKFPKTHHGMIVTSEEAIRKADLFRNSTASELLCSKEYAVKFSEYVLEQKYKNKIMWERYREAPRDKQNKAWMDEMMGIFNQLCKKCLYDIEREEKEMMKRKLATRLFGIQFRYKKLLNQPNFQKLKFLCEKKGFQLSVENKHLGALLMFYYLRPDLVTREVHPNVLIEDIPKQDFDDVAETDLQVIWEKLCRSGDVGFFSK
jgi:hypothetical protein